MLTKSQARLFFVGGTVGFSLLFFFLTWDTIRQVPKQTNEHNLTAAAKRGKLLFDENNCMGCHTILGEGAYYAPELTKVVDRRGAPWIRQFMKDPQKMFPGRRKMVKYDFTEGEITDLIAFFTWIGQMDLNGFPPEPDIEPPSSGKKAAAGTAEPAQISVCRGCHKIAGNGGVVGPSLDGIKKKYDKEYLIKWISDPQKIKPGTTMPDLGLKPEEVEEVSEFLLKL